MIKCNYVLVVMTCGLLLTSLSSYGQSQKDSLTSKITLDASGRSIGGTFKQLVAGGGLSFDLQYKNFHIENRTTYRYNKTNSRLIEDNWYDLVVFKFYPNGKKKLYPGVFYHFDNNLMFKVQARHQFGIGLGSTLDKGGMNLSLLTAIANEHTRFNGLEFVNSELDMPMRKNGLFLFKLNNGFALVKKKIYFSYQLFYFQSLKEKNDYDLWFSPKIRFKLIKNLSFHIVYDYRFENVHLASLSNYNDILLFGFNWSTSM